jgi:NitT/TauT family transport system substrate-binding protein
MPGLRIMVIGWWLWIAGLACLAAAPALAADVVRLAVQKTGTLAWEIDVVRRHGLDSAAGITIASTELASPEAGKIALRSGTVDIMVSDWLWVSRERGLGADLVFYPYSSALGAVMVPMASSIRSLADLKGRKLAVAGGPIDKNWLLLQGAMKQDGIDLRTEATIAYGAPVLLAEKTRQGEMDATLNFWNICAGLEAKGFRRVAGVEDILPRLGARGRPALLGYVFDGGWAARNRDTITRFIEVTRKAKEVLATSDAEWDRIAPLVRAVDQPALETYRKRYREGIPRRAINDEEEDARTLFAVLAQLGGRELVGPDKVLAPGTFYRPDSRN